MKLPEFLNFQKKYGLLIADSEVTLLSWKRGEIERIAIFPNDENGVTSMQEFFAENKELNDNPFYVLLNIIGEDYRFEKVAHLIGKHKTDFHAKKMRQMFRGSQFFVSEVQGREERGRREDWVLFSGVLTENKVLPWVNELTRGGRFLAGIHMASHILSDTIVKSVDGHGEGNNLLLTIHERGLLRQTFFVNGHLRFSRVSKINDDDAQSTSASLRKELDRTLQYLNSLKISIGNGLDVRMIAPSNMVSQLRESVSGTERVRVHFYDVGATASQIGLKAPIGTLGKDSSLPLQVMFSSFVLWMKQLARPQLVTYYYTQVLAKLAVACFVIYGINAYWIPADYYIEGRFTHEAAVPELREQANDMQQQYDREVDVAGTPPSSSENMKAVTEFYSVLDNIKVAPTQLLYYVGQALSKNDKIRLDSLEWQISNTAEGSAGSIDDAIINGKDLYQIALIEGEIEEIGINETYRDVSRRADKLVNSFQKRDDIFVEVVEVPSSEISTENLTGSLEEVKNLEAPTSRKFVLRIIWKSYDGESISRIIEQS